MFTITRTVTPNPTLAFCRKICSKAAVPISSIKFPNTKGPLGQPAPHTHPHLVAEDEITPLIKRSEYQCRREKLVDSLLKNAANAKSPKKNHMIIIPSATKQYMSDKIPYVFRQNSDFLYLTGCQEPDCCVVITTDESGNRRCTTLFTRDKDEHAELWDGPRTHPEDAVDFFGVDESLPISQLPKFLKSHQKETKNLNVWYDFPQNINQSINSVVCDFLKDAGGRLYGESPRPLIHRLRLFKSPAEIALMQKACDATSRAFIEAMASSRPGIGENHIFARVDYECRTRGAERLAYPPVIAGGSRATTIHYINNDQIVCNKEMVLMDAGCEMHGYSSDITRTWPVNGTFTKEQRDIYEAVLCVQEHLIHLLNDFPTLDGLFESMCYLLGKKLQEIGVIGIQPSNRYLMRAAYQLCPHHVSHYLGMDVHDTPTVTRDIKVEPGMVVTVEPGIYISEGNKMVPKNFHGIGVRIEDDVLITVNGPVVLSRRCPKKIEELEKIVWKCQD